MAVSKGSLGIGLPLPVPTAGQTVAAAQKHLRSKAGDGVACPCCGRLAKVYRRKLHGEMAAFLCRLVRASGPRRNWTHIRNVLRGGRTTQKASTDGAFLVHWGLVERKAAAPGQPSSGLYRPTPDGVRFANGRLRVPSHVYLFNNVKVALDVETVDVHEALGVDFSYLDLMGR